MKPFETNTVEYKLKVTDKILKEVLAFANVAGGTIFIGVDDSGDVIGIEDIDNQYTQLTNMIRDGISPDITLFTSSEIVVENGRRYIKLVVSVGSSRPYYLRSKGLRPEGVYVRQGASSVPASMEQIREMIKQTDGVRYESIRSLNQNLTFIYTTEAFRSVGVDFGEPQFLTLGIKTPDGLYTNLGLLLSDQCPHLVKAASFRGASRVNFKHRKELTGSVLKQAEDAFQYATLGLPTLTTYSGTRRIDTYVVDPTAIREGIYNALVHREYGMDGPTMLSVFDDRIEILSLGGIPIPGGASALIPGASFCRNKALADVFYRLRLIEAYGTGLPKISDTYADSVTEYTLDITESMFRITLPYKPEVLQGISEQENAVKMAQKTSLFSNDKDI